MNMKSWIKWKLIPLYSLLLLLCVSSSAATAGKIINSATVDGTSSTSVSAGDTISVTINVSTSGGGANKKWESTAWLIATSSGSFTGCDTSPSIISSTTTDVTFNVTAPTTDGTYNLYLKAYSNDGCNGNSSSTFELSGAVEVGSLASGITIDSASVDGASSTTVEPDATVSVTVNATTAGTGSDKNWNSTAWRIAGSSGSLTCENHADNTSAGSHSVTFNTTAPSTDGSYNLYLVGYNDDSCSTGASNEFILSNAVVVSTPAPSSSELLCSSEQGNAVINEIQTQDNFIEIYLINSSDILNWSLYVDTTKIATLGTGSCEINGTASKDNTGTGATNTTFPAGTFITCDHNMNPSKDEVLLVDTNGSFANGDNVVIDYIGYGNLTPSADWSVNSSCGVLYPGHAANNKDIARIPDGTGPLIDNDSNSTKGTTNDPTLPEIDHFEISYSANGITCLASPITLKACANSDCSSLFTGNVTVTFSSGGWSPSSVTLTTGVSSAISLQKITPGSYSIGISSSSETPENGLTCYADNVLDPSCTINFAEAGFVFDVPTLTACKTSADVTLRAVKMSDTSTQCVGALTGSQTVQFWSTYSNPSSGSNQVNISGTDVATSSPGTNVNLTFNANGEATFTTTYDDVGQIRLDASHTMTTSDGDLTLEGNDTFISKPVALAVYSSDTNSSCSSGNASCSRFKKAGEDFNLNVKAACWTSDADSDYSDNPATGNFELSSISVNHTLIAPSGGNTGSLGVNNFNFSTSDNGIHTVTQSVSEVGVFTFGVSPPTYLGESLTTAVSPDIGRFYPDHFEVTDQANGAFGDHACNTFSYSGQDFTYTTNPKLTITAYNAASPAAITQNYTGSFAKIDVTDFTVTSPTTDATQIGADATNNVNLSWTPASTSLTDNNDGTHTFSFGTDTYRYNHEANSRIAPFTNAVELEFTDITDSDSVATNSLPVTLQPSGESIRFGRFAVGTAHGSELVDLPISFQAEYFDGINWQINTADQCTSLALASHFQLSNSSSGGWQTGNTAMTIGSGTTSASLSNNSPLVSGTGLITFSAPGENNQGYVDIQTQLLGPFNWLLGDYDNDGVYDDEATGKASFGIFSGSDNIIFRREVY